MEMTRFVEYNLMETKLRRVTREKLKVAKEVIGCFFSNFLYSVRE